MIEIKEIYAAVQAGLLSVGAEITSSWFYFQVGLIVAAAGLAHSSTFDAPTTIGRWLDLLDDERHP